MISPVILIVIGSVLCLWWALAVVTTGLAVRPGRLVDRWDAVSRVASLAFVMPLCLVAVAWTLVPVALWYLLTVLTAAVVAGVVLRAVDLPTRGADPAAPTRRASAIGNTALAIAVVAGLLLVLP
ncbi:hypothetical protein [Nocardiopsis lambiniae]|uniref:DUF5134 domain-containing protein n=1 Tax=Nocardiopsis lambiniae TaxID=3075539 RepID=A0ABU2M7J1_9ACTN|nr:hypothetical protein [Nocardiopsis sp. DSM 44743]MDT0328639.1 hypothetical protein [Nocardiopsis sp. DSM 44743]